MKSAILRKPCEIDELEDWGPVPSMIEGESLTSGVFLHRGTDASDEFDGSESGLWVCMPGYWNCHVTRDEFCHFLEGR